MKHYIHQEITRLYANCPVEPKPTPPRRLSWGRARLVTLVEFGQQWLRQQAEPFVS